MENKKSEPLSKETLRAFNELGDILRPIRTRMIASGKYEIINGKIGIIKK